MSDGSGNKVVRQLLIFLLRTNKSSPSITDISFFLFKTRTITHHSRWDFWFSYLYLDRIFGPWKVIMDPIVSDEPSYEENELENT
jgi:hypothetical protein